MKFGVVISAANEIAPMPGAKAPLMYRGNLEKNIIKLKDMGYNGIELGGVRDKKDVDLSSISKVLSKTGMEVATIGTGQPYLDKGVNLSDPDKRIRAEAVKQLKPLIEIAGKLNAPVMLSLIFGKVKHAGKSEKDELENAKNRIAECIEEFMIFSEKYSTIFLLEPLNRYENNIFNKLEDASNFIKDNKDKLDENRIGIIADTYHMNIEETIIQKSFENFIDDIKHVHFADSNRALPGNGHIDFKSVINVLKKKKYDKFISLEVSPYDDPDISAREGINYLKSNI